MNTPLTFKRVVLTTLGVTAALAFWSFLIPVAFACGMALGIHILG